MTFKFRWYFAGSVPSFSWYLLVSWFGSVNSEVATKFTVRTGILGDYVILIFCLSFRILGFSMRVRVETLEFPKCQI